ncbi:MAG: Holliday junction branch migration protein RuvA [Planctomycetota bacterium]|jgi:Holliday junction DNA helicase RuvA
MISRIHGILDSIGPDAAYLTVEGGLTYEVLVPAYVGARLGLQIGAPVTLYTLHYLEGSSSGANMTPRLAGFLTEADKGFFELFTTIKGIGPKKALKAMSLSTGQIAAAIADRDAKTLQALPGIGKKAAETIVVTLNDKVDPYIDPTAHTAQLADTQSGDTTPPSGGAPSRATAREALAVLEQLGENRAQAVGWIDEVLVHQPDIDDAQTLIAEVLRVKTGA